MLISPDATIVGVMLGVFVASMPVGVAVILPDVGLGDAGTETVIGVVVAVGLPVGAPCPPVGVGVAMGVFVG